LKAKILKLIISARIVIAPATSYASDLTYRDLMIKDDSTFVSPATVSQQSVKDDLALLKYAFINGYGGYKFLPSSATDDLLNKIATFNTKAPLSSTALCRFIGDALWDLPDNHLSARIGKDRCGETRLKEVRKATVGKNFALSYKEKTGAPWHWEKTSVKNLSIGKLGITDFPFYEDKAWSGFDDVISKIKQMDALIIDLRGNGGGDDGRGFDLAKSLLGQPVEPGWDATIVRQTPEALVLLMNIFQYQKTLAISEKRTPEPYLDDRMVEIQKKIDLANANKLPIEDKRERHPKQNFKLQENSFKGPIYVLIDAECASSCESSLEAILNHPLAKAVGENTGGYFHFGDVGRIILPNSRIVIGLPTKYNKYRDDRSYEKVGFTPHIKVAGGTDAMAVALKSF
jgi:hypothetical protein